MSEKEVIELKREQWKKEKAERASQWVEWWSHHRQVHRKPLESVSDTV